MKLTPELEKEIRDALEKSTKVVGWYPHSQFDGYHLGKASVRGPFGRWFLVEGGDNGMGDPVKHPTPVADLFDDAKYAAIAMNSVPVLLNEIDELREEFLAEHGENVRLFFENEELLELLKFRANENHELTAELALRKAFELDFDKLRGRLSLMEGERDGLHRLAKESCRYLDDLGIPLTTEALAAFRVTAFYANNKCGLCMPDKPCNFEACPNDDVTKGNE